MSQKKRRGGSHTSAQLSRVVFLGTSSAQPIPLKRNVSCLVIQTSKGNLSIVDCGEGTQHQFKLSTLKIGKLRNIFITHLHGDHCYGLFGLLHSIRHENRDFTLHIYGPKGIKEMINTTLALSGGLYHYLLKIHEISLPNNRNKNTKNTQNDNDNDNICNMDVSCNEAETDEDLSMISNKPNENVWENKAALFDTNDIIDLGEIEPGIKCFACALTHGIETFGYVFIEDNQLGKLDAATAMAMGAKGRQLGLLKSGIDVTLDNGVTIYSKDVVGKQIIGNKIAVMQDCSDCRSCFRIAQNCDLFIHECTYDEEYKLYAIPRGHSTAKMAALNACKVNAKMLMLTHFSSRFVEGAPVSAETKNDDDDDDDDDDLMHVQRLQKEAEEEIDHNASKCIVRCAADFMSIRFGKNKIITIDKDLAITESKKCHFQHDLPYLKLICDQ